MNLEKLFAETIEQADKQNKELEAMVSVEATRTRIRLLIAHVLTEFMYMSTDERRLTLKFLIEGVEQIAQVKNL